jgi:hypothetical protein
VTLEEGASLAAEYRIHFFETSASQNVNIEEAFITLVKLVKQRLDESDRLKAHINEANGALALGKDTPKDGRCGCK